MSKDQSCGFNGAAEGAEFRRKTCNFLRDGKSSVLIGDLREQRELRGRGAVFYEIRGHKYIAVQFLLAPPVQSSGRFGGFLAGSGFSKLKLGF